MNTKAINNRLNELNQHYESLTKNLAYFSKGKMFYDDKIKQFADELIKVRTEIDQLNKELNA